jgi:hypothetical protein
VFGQKLERWRLAAGHGALQGLENSRHILSYRLSHSNTTFGRYDQNLPENTPVEKEKTSPGNSQLKIVRQFSKKIS